MKESATKVYDVCVVGSGAAGGAVLQKARGGGHDSTHYVGTCKMGTDPKTSVLTPFCRTHDVENLFVADGSCFVDYPEKNPTLTVMAIAARTAPCTVPIVPTQGDKQTWLVIVVSHIWAQARSKYKR